MTEQHALGGAEIPQWTQADRLRKAREAAGLTQWELARDIGVSQRSISAYETDGTEKRPVLLSWALRTNVPLEWLQRGDAAGARSGPTPPDGGGQEVPPAGLEPAANCLIGRRYGRRNVARVTPVRWREAA